MPCRGGVPPMTAEEIAPLATQLQPAWKVVDNQYLQREWKVANFAAALEMVNKFGAIAEAEGHHPDITFGWGYVKVKIWTHKIKGLTRSDFVLAAKYDNYI